MATKRPKNILFIWTDQQRPDTIGAFGNPQVDTPHLDRLLEQSVCFDQAYCSQPVCAPARGTALTGLYPHTHGVVTNGIPLDPAVPAIAELLRPAGLVSGHIGMWHLAHKAEPLRPQRGFERFWVSTEDQYTASHAAEGYSSYHDFLLAQGYTPADPHMATGRSLPARRRHACRRRSPSPPSRPPRRSGFWRPMVTIRSCSSSESTSRIRRATALSTTTTGQRT